MTIQGGLDSRFRGNDRRWNDRRESATRTGPVTTHDGTVCPMTLCHTEWCPECALVRTRLDELEIAYKRVIVPTARPFRKHLFEVSGQYYVPVLVDGSTGLTDTQDILNHLDAMASTLRKPTSSKE